MIFTKRILIQYRTMFATALCFISLSGYGDQSSIFEQLITNRPILGPADSLLAPTAFGVGWGEIYGGVTGQTGNAHSSEPFGRYGLGFGLGDPCRYFSLDSAVTFGGLDEGTRDGSLNFQFSRFLTPTWAVGLGTNNVAAWGGDEENKVSTYFVTSKMFSIAPTDYDDLNLFGTVGVGNGQYVHNYAVPHPNRDLHTARLFASLGVQVLPQAAVIVDYVGSTYNAGLSIVPLAQFPLIATVSVIDFTSHAGSRMPVAFTLAYAYHFANNGCSSRLASSDDAEEPSNQQALRQPSSGAGFITPLLPSANGVASKL